MCGSMLYIRHQYDSALCINTACTMHHASRLYLNPVHHGSMQCICGLLVCIRHQQYTFIAQCCVSGNNMLVHHASIWFDAVHSRLNDVHQAYICRNMAQCCASGITMAQYSVWLNAVQASVYDPMLCIRHHNVAQACMCTMYQYGQMQCIHGSSCASCINRVCLITLNLPHHTLSSSFFATLFAVKTWRREIR